MEDKLYKVDMKAGLCECFKGFLKGPCKHKGAVSLIYKLHNFDALPQQNENMRSFYHFLATGTQKDIAWFRPINGENSFPELHWEENNDSQSENLEEQTPIIHENVGDVIHDEIGKDEAIQSLTEAMENVRNKIKERFDHDLTNY